MKAKPLGKLLQRLARDRRGNMLAIMAAALVPMIGMAGGGLDASRLYLAKTRLQQACDAATLAGRRAMSGANWTTENQSVANEFFHANFTPGRYGTNAETISYAVGADQVVHGTATVKVPMVMMQVFGVETQTLTTKCDAELQVPNSDIMFVLDTTLSMNTVDQGEAKSRIEGLREAVMSFWDEMEKAHGTSSQVRYGFVPYSNTVNVGALLRADWIRDEAEYQSRQYLDTSETMVPGWVPVDNWVTVSGYYTTSAETSADESCSQPSNENFSNPTTYEYSPTGDTRKATQIWKGINYTTNRNGSTGVCTITKYTFYTWTNTRNEKLAQVSQKADYYRYDKLPYSLTPLKVEDSSGLKGGQLPVKTLFSNGATSPTPVVWNSASGNMCIEERDTLPTSDKEKVPTGSALYDLNVDLVPTSDKRTQWTPWLPKLIYARGIGNYYPSNGQKIGNWAINPIARTYLNYITPSSFPSDFAACPAAARKLKPIPKTDQSILQTYVNSLKPAGHTYHDIGFLWGLRLMSAEGLFGSENAKAANGGSIARHIVFMTDGETGGNPGESGTNRADYDAYGISALDQRRTVFSSTTPPADSDQDTIVKTRLSNLCEVAKGKNITVWVIAYSSTLSSTLKSCASSDDRAFTASNSDELIKTFRSIASQISQLRLTK